MPRRADLLVEPLRLAELRLLPFCIAQRRGQNGCGLVDPGDMDPALDARREFAGAREGGARP